MTDRLILTEVSLASRAKLSDPDLRHIVDNGFGGWLRGIAKRVESGRLPESVAVNLIVERAEELSFAAKVPTPILFIIGLWIKAVKARRVYAS